MVLVGVSKLGKTSVAFIEKGARINQEYYCSHVLVSLISEVDNLVDEKCVFMQDGARSHTAKSTVEYLNSHASEFIKPVHGPQIVSFIFFKSNSV